MKRMRLLFFIIILGVVMLVPIMTSADEVQSIPKPKYPGTNVEMRPGDILSSPKSWSSTKFFGHTAIVGPNYEIIHSHPVEDRAVSESISSFMSRHSSGDRIKVYRSSIGGSSTAASWAANNYRRADDYGIDDNLVGITPNYCSKFVWQAWYLSSGRKIVNKYPTSPDPVTPGEIESSGSTYHATSFWTP